MSFEDASERSSKAKSWLGIICLRKFKISASWQILEKMSKLEVLKTSLNSPKKRIKKVKTFLVLMTNRCLMLWVQRNWHLQPQLENRKEIHCWRSKKPMMFQSCSMSRAVLFNTQFRRLLKSISTWSSENQNWCTLSLRLKLQWPSFFSGKSSSLSLIDRTLWLSRSNHPWWQKVTRRIRIPQIKPKLRRISHMVIKDWQQKSRKDSQWLLKIKMWSKIPPNLLKLTSNLKSLLP